MQHPERVACGFFQVYPSYLECDGTNEVKEILLESLCVVFGFPQAFDAPALVLQDERQKRDLALIQSLFDDLPIPSLKGLGVENQRHPTILLCFVCSSTSFSQPLFN